MKTLLTILLATLCAATGYGQTIKALSYNSSNNTIVATQRVTFPLLGVASGTAGTPSLAYASGTNVFGTFAAAQLGVGPYLGFSVDGTRRFFISTNTIRAELPLSFDNTTNGAITRTNLSLGWPALTNSNAAISLLGINASNEVVAATNITFTNGVAFTTNAAAATLANLGLGTNASVTLSNLNAQSVSITNTGAFRTNIGLPLAALTNTSNVTFMRALAGTTNTNMPLSGTMIIDPANTYEMVVSNGIILDFYVQ
jgi:hypothetical protein